MRITIERKQGRKRPRKREFSKTWLAACIVISIIYTSASFVLAWFDKNPVSELSIAIVENLWGASGISFVGYAVQNSVRAYTSAKFNLYDKLKEEEEDADE